MTRHSRFPAFGFVGLPVLTIGLLTGNASAQTRSPHVQAARDSRIAQATTPAVGLRWRDRAVEPSSSSEPLQRQAVPQHDPLSNGVLIGAAAGAGVGLVLGVVDNARQRPVDCARSYYFSFCGANFGPSDGQVLAISTLLGAGVGAIVGLVVDAVHHDDARPRPLSGLGSAKDLKLAPVISWRQTGMVLFVRW